MVVRAPQPGAGVTLDESDTTPGGRRPSFRRRSTRHPGSPVSSPARRQRRGRPARRPSRGSSCSTASRSPRTSSTRVEQLGVITFRPGPDRSSLARARREHGRRPLLAAARSDPRPDLLRRSRFSWRLPRRNRGRLRSICSTAAPRTALDAIAARAAVRRPPAGTSRSRRARRASAASAMNSSRVPAGHVRDRAQRPLAPEQRVVERRDRRSCGCRRGDGAAGPHDLERDRDELTRRREHDGTVARARRQRRPRDRPTWRRAPRQLAVALTTREHDHLATPVAQHLRARGAPTRRTRAARPARPAATSARRSAR